MADIRNVDGEMDEKTRYSVCYHVQQTLIIYIDDNRSGNKTINDFISPEHIEYCYVHTMCFNMKEGYGKTSCFAKWKPDQPINDTDGITLYCAFCLSSNVN